MSSLEKDVKHIFYTHSWITQLIAESIIESEGLKHENIILLSNRQFKNSLDPVLKSRFTNCRKLILDNWFDAITSIYRVYKYDQWISKITEGQPFILYVPHLHPIGLKLFKIHPSCNKCFLLEEGTMSFLGKEEVNHRFSVDRERSKYFNLFWNKRLQRATEIKTFDESVENVIKASKLAFPDFHQPKILADQFKMLLSRIKVNDEINTVLVLAPYVTVLNLKLNIYLRKFAIVIESLVKKTYGKIHYKFHPSDSIEVRNGTNSILSKYYDRFVLLDDGICLEAILYKRKPLVITFPSSVAIYSLEFDCRLVILNGMINPDALASVPGFDFKPYYAPEI